MLTYFYPWVISSEYLYIIVISIPMHVFLATRLTKLVHQKQLREKIKKFERKHKQG